MTETVTSGSRWQRMETADRDVLTAACRFLSSIDCRLRHSLTLQRAIFDGVTAARRVKIPGMSPCRQAGSGGFITLCKAV